LPDDRSGPEGTPWDTEEIEDLALQRGEVGVKDLHGATGTAEHVPLGVAEQPQHLLGGRVGAATLLGI
jgi:hypothetical protein